MHASDGTLKTENLYVIEKIKCNFVDGKLTCYTWSKRKDDKSARHKKSVKHHLQELEEENKENFIFWEGADAMENT